MNYTRPPLAVLLEPIKNAFLDAKKRGVKLRYLTEVTSENIAAAKELIKIVDELRHLDGIKGNFIVSESGYLAPLILFEKWKIASQVICSDIKEIIDQHRYVFDTFWNKAIPAQQKIKELEEGIVHYETKVLEEHENEKKISYFKEYIENSNQLSVCTRVNRMQFVYDNFIKAIESILDKSKKGEHKGIRWLTSINDKDGASLAKVFLDYGIIIRHTDQIPLSFGVSDKGVVGSIANTEGVEMSRTLFVSNEPVYVKHFDTLFEELWRNSVDSKDRIREIEEGLAPVKTRILHDQDEIIREMKQKNNSVKRLSICTGFGGMQMGYQYLFDSYRSIVDKNRKEQEKGDGLRWITNINKESLDLVKIFLDNGIRIRHTRNMPPISFGVSDKEVAITIEKMEGSKMSQSFLISNEPLYTLHFNSVFEELWKDGIDAQDRIKDIELGAESVDVEVIPLSSRARVLYLNLVKEAEKEIIIMFPTTNAFLRQYILGAVPFAKEVSQKRNVCVRVLMPKHESTEKLVRSFIEEEEEQIRRSGNLIDVRYIEQTGLDTHATILVVDRKASLVMEIRDDSKRTFDEAIGLSTYSNSRPGVLSYISIFENLWKETELYQDIKQAHEQLQLHDKAQKEFINVAAHELRTPIQPVLGLTDILLSKTGSIEQYRDMLDTINRNARRLSRLSADILDATKIESRSLELKKERFNLNDIILNAMDDIILGKDVRKNMNVQLLYDPQDIEVEADKGRTSQIIANLLSNALKFTKKGTITITTKLDKNNNQVFLTVKDTGSGIASEILPELFSKFTARSFSGTGLGLFISKSIVEAHGGKIWGENNSDGIGATFTFTLPTSR